MKNFPKFPNTGAHLPDSYLCTDYYENLYYAVHIFQQPTVCIRKCIMDILQSQSIEAKFNHYNGCLVFNGVEVP